MKTLPTIMLLSVFAFVLSSFNSQNSNLSIENAVKEKKIEIRIIPNGTYSGNSINLEITNLSNGKLNLEMTPGTVFIPDDDGEQTLMNTEDVLLAMNKNEVRMIKVNAYCTEASDHCPSKNSKFTLAQTPNASLRKLAYFLDSLKTGNGITQQSIWCLTDSESVSNVYDDDSQTSKALRGFLCSLTGQKDTWYSTRREIRVDQQNNIVSIPKEIKGDIEFVSTESVELQGTVVDSTGKVLITNPNKTVLPAGKIKFEFNLKIAGWKPGRYAVVYTNNGKEVIRQGFSF